MRDFRILPEENDLGMARSGIAPNDIDENACFAFSSPTVTLRMLAQNLVETLRLLTTVPSVGLC